MLYNLMAVGDTLPYNNIVMDGTILWTVCFRWPGLGAWVGWLAGWALHLNKAASQQSPLHGNYSIQQSDGIDTEMASSYTNGCVTSFRRRRGNNNGSPSPTDHHSLPMTAISMQSLLRRRRR